MQHRHILAVIVNNRPGVLSKVSGLFSRRGFNIQSLAVGETENPDYSRMTITVMGDDQVIEQITKQLYKLIDVIRVYDLPEADAVERELVLIKVHASGKAREEVFQIAKVFEAKVVDIGDDYVTMELSADNVAVKNFETALKKFGIKKLVRTGTIAIGRGKLE